MNYHPSMFLKPSSKIINNPNPPQQTNYYQNNPQFNNMNIHFYPNNSPNNRMEYQGNKQHNQNIIPLEEFDQLSMQAQGIDTRLQELRQGLVLASSRVLGFIRQFQWEIVEIQRVLQGYSRNEQLTSYLLRFCKEYQRLGMDLESKREFLQILEARMTNFNEIPSIEGWLNIINVKYLAELEKKVMTMNWRDIASKYQPDNNISAGQNINHTNAAENIVKNCQQNMSISSLSKSDIVIQNNRQSGNSLNLSLIETSTVHRSSINIDSGSAGNVLQQAKIINPNNLLVENTIQKGSLISSSNSRTQSAQYVIQYSDAQTLKSQSMNRWMEEFGIVDDSFNGSVLSDEFQPFIPTNPFLLGGSYRPITQSQSSHRSSYNANHQILQKSCTQSQSLRK